MSWFRVAGLSAIFLLALSLRAPAIAAPPMRIVSLAPSVTETLFALGAGSDVVGVSQYCDYPAEVRKLPRVGSQRELHALTAMGYPLLLVSDASLDEIENSIGEVGARIGRPREARVLAAQIRAQIAEVSERLSSASTVRALMLVGHQPIVAVGRGTFLNQLLQLARADNIAAVSGQEWPQLSIEYIIAMRPQVILDGSMGNDPTSPSKFWESYRTIPAVSDHRVFGYPQDPILHSGPRVGRSLEILARMIHPEAWRGVAESGK